MALGLLKKIFFSKPKEKVEKDISDMRNGAMARIMGAVDRGAYRAAGLLLGVEQRAMFCAFRPEIANVFHKYSRHNPHTKARLVYKKEGTGDARSVREPKHYLEEQPYLVEIVTDVDDERIEQIKADMWGWVEAKREATPEWVESQKENLLSGLSERGKVALIDDSKFQLEIGGADTLVTGLVAEAIQKYRKAFLAIANGALGYCGQAIYYLSDVKRFRRRYVLYPGEGMTEFPDRQRLDDLGVLLKQMKDEVEKAGKSGYLYADLSLLSGKVDLRVKIADRHLDGWLANERLPVSSYVQLVEDQKKELELRLRASLEELACNMPNMVRRRVLFDFENNVADYDLRLEVIPFTQDGQLPTQQLDFVPGDGAYVSDPIELLASPANKVVKVRVRVLVKHPYLTREYERTAELPVQ